MDKTNFITKKIKDRKKTKIISAIVLVITPLTHNTTDAQKLDYEFQYKIELIPEPGIWNCPR